MKPVARIRGWGEYRGEIRRTARLLKGVCVVRVYGLSKVAREERWLKGLVERRRERKAARKWRTIVVSR